MTRIAAPHHMEQGPIRVAAFARRVLLSARLAPKIKGHAPLRIPAAVEAEPLREDRRVLMARGVVLCGLVAGRAPAVDAEEEVFAARVDEPKFGNARSVIGGGQPLGVFANRRVADDLDDQIGRAL